MTVVYLCAAVATLSVVLWAAWQRGAVGALGRVVLGLLTAVTTIVGLAAAAFLGMVLLGLGSPLRDFGGVVLFAGAQMGLIVFAPIAIVLWVVMRQAIRRGRSRPEGEPQAARVKATRTGAVAMLGVVAVSLAVGTYAALHRDAHDHGIFAVRFVDGTQRIYSVDRWRVLKVWRRTGALPLEPDAPAPYVQAARIELPIDFVPVGMRVSRHGGHVALLDHAKGVTIVQVDPSRQSAAVVATFPRGIAMTEYGGEFIIAAWDAVHWVVPGEKTPRRTLPWRSEIAAIDAGARGVVLAERQGAVALLEGAQATPRQVATTSFVTSNILFTSDERSLVALRGVGPGTVLALDDDRALDFDIRSSFAWPVGGPLVLSCDGRSGRCQTLDSRDGRLMKSVEGVMPAVQSADAVPGAVALALEGRLAVVTLSDEGQPRGFAFLH